MTSDTRSLRGGCHCGRNRYMVDLPEDVAETQNAQVIFNADSIHQSSLATPLAAFLRVPLASYRSTTFSFFPDETHAMIHRVFESQSPSQQQTKRHFCGFCGTPLSFWTERPRSEADYIQLTLASLRDQDLRDLEDMGLVPGLGGDSDTEEEEAEQVERDDIDNDHPVVVPAAAEAPVSSTSSMDVDPGPRATSRSSMPLMHREVRGIPWFDNLMEGSRLGNVHKRQGVSESRDGSTRVEWEIVEWTDGDGDEEDESPAVVDLEKDKAGEEQEDVDMGGAGGGNVKKRKAQDRAA